MNILLLSMPDSFEHMPTVAIRMPNGALTSLAGNVDPHHKVAVADLILVPKRVRESVTRLISTINPDVVGLSVMTFQRKTALKIAGLVRSLKPAVHIVVGGYDPSLAADAYTHADSSVDFVVRGEGEFTFSSLLRAIESGSDYASIHGLSFRSGNGFVHNPDRHVSRLERDEIRPPNRAARVLKGYTLIGRQVDVIETSRGCTSTAVSARSLKCAGAISSPTIWIASLQTSGMPKTTGLRRSSSSTTTLLWTSTASKHSARLSLKRDSTNWTTQCKP